MWHLISEPNPRTCQVHAHVRIKRALYVPPRLAKRTRARPAPHGMSACTLRTPHIMYATPHALYAPHVLYAPRVSVLPIAFSPAHLSNFMPSKATCPYKCNAPAPALRALGSCRGLRRRKVPGRLCTALHCSALLCTALHCSAPLCSAPHRSAPLCSALRRSAPLCTHSFPPLGSTLFLNLCFCFTSSLHFSSLPALRLSASPPLLSSPAALSGCALRLSSAPLLSAYPLAPCPYRSAA